MELKNFFVGKASGFVIVFAIVFAFFTTKYFLEQPATNIEVESKNDKKVVEIIPITITHQEFKEENFSGSKPIISSESNLAILGRKFVDEHIAEFKSWADAGVPDMRKKFGASSAVATWTIDIEAKNLKGPKTETLLISTYAYTGGANGNSAYKAITVSNSTGKVVSLASIIKIDKQESFIAIVKKELNDWSEYGDGSGMVFGESLDEYTINDFEDWSIDASNLTLYFDKFEIGAGALGSVAFPIPLNKISDILEII